MNFTYGRRGTSGQSGFKVSGVSYDDAKKAYDKTVKEKTAKGYRPLEGTLTGSVPHASIPTEKVDTGIYPQLLNPIKEEEVEKYLKNDNFGAQEKLDGKRKFLKHGNNNTISINRKGQEVGYPAVFKGACVTLTQKGIDKFVFDGEEVNNTLFIFDVLYLNEDDLRELPYSQRYNKLTFIPENSVLKIVPLATDYKAKKALYERLLKEKREGIVFKRLDAPYKEGRPQTGGDQVKFKFYETASCIVIKINTKRSIGLGLYDNGNLIDVGNCTIPPNKSIPEKNQIVEIKYLYAYKGGSLYQPIYLGLRDDIEKTACITDQLKYKAEEE